MPSPFPGMNPYLESAYMWPDFHNRFIHALADDIAAKVSPHFFAKIEEQLYLHELPESRIRFFGQSDVGIRPANTPLAVELASTTATMTPPQRVTVPAHVIQLKLSYLQIFERHSRELVTVVELLSPCDKFTGPDRHAYITKRTRYLHSQVNFVEIDLLRGGPRMPWDGTTACDYCVAISRKSERPHVGFWALKLKDRLPVIPIPLTPSFAEPTVDLQELLNRVYDAAHYQDFAYLDPPEPALSTADQAWAAGLLGTTPPAG